MNEAEVRAIPVYGGFMAEFKKIHRSKWHPVEENGQTLLFDTALEAENAAYKALMRHLFGDGIVRSGDKASAARSEAEKHFGKIFPGRGRKPVEVVRR